jgi:hypothetical protein
MLLLEARAHVDELGPALELDRRVGAVDYDGLSTPGDRLAEGEHALRVVALLEHEAVVGAGAEQLLHARAGEHGLRARERVGARDLDPGLPIQVEHAGPALAVGARRRGKI